MEPFTDRIASVPLTTVLFLIALLTAVRVWLCGARARRSPLRASRRSLSDLLESLLIALVLVFLLFRPFVVQSFFIPSGSMHPTLWEGDRILVNKWVYRMASPEHGDVIVFRAPATASATEHDFIKRLIGLPGDVIEVREGYVELVGRGEPILYTRSEIRAVLGAGGSVGQILQRDSQPLRLTTDALWLGMRKITKEQFASAAGHPGEPVRIAPGRVLRNGVMLCEDYVSEDPGYRWGPRRIPPGHLFVMGDNRNESHDSHIWGTLPASRVIGRADWVFWPLGHMKRLP